MCSVTELARLQKPAQRTHLALNVELPVASFITSALAFAVKFSLFRDPHS